MKIYISELNVIMGDSFRNISYTLDLVADIQENLRKKVTGCEENVSA